VPPGRRPGAFGHFTPGHFTPGHFTPGHFTPGHFTPGHFTVAPVAELARACLDLGVSAGQMGPSGQYG
jgi:hypothetical protein